MLKMVFKSLNSDELSYVREIFTRVIEKTSRVLHNYGKEI